MQSTRTQRFRSAPKRALVILSVAVALLMSACLPKLTRQPPDRVYYGLEVDRGDAPRAAAPITNADGEPATLAVRGFRTAAGFEGRRLVYSSGPSRFEADYYNAFFVPVPALLSQITSAWLRDSGLFAGVVESGSLLDTDYVLEASVRSCHGDYRDPADCRAVVAIQTFLLRNDDTGAVLLRQADYDVRVAVEGRSPDELVRGYELAIREILERFERDLAAFDFDAAATAELRPSRP